MCISLKETVYNFPKYVSVRCESQAYGLFLSFEEIKETKELVNDRQVLVDMHDDMTSLHHAMCALSCFSLTLWTLLTIAAQTSLSMGVLQVTMLEWVVLPSSRGSSQPRDWTCVSCLLHLHVGSLPVVPLGKPQKFMVLLIFSTKYRCIFFSYAVEETEIQRAL